MPTSDGFLELLKDALSGFGPVSVRRMFGGAGLYAGGVMFGLVIDDTLYLKADDATRARSRPKGWPLRLFDARPIRFHVLLARAERLLDDPEEMEGWARTALDVARRKAAAQPKGSAPADCDRRAACDRSGPRHRPVSQDRRLRCATQHLCNWVLSSRAAAIEPARDKKGAARRLLRFGT